MIEHFFFWILLLLCAGYFSIYCVLWHGLTGLLSPKVAADQQGISIIVAARNEERHIAQLLQSLVSQNYPPEKFEILVMNDRSTDSTASIVESFALLHGNVRLVNITSNSSDMPHKKNALRSGIAQSKFDILAFTDADCEVPKNWLAEISKNFPDDFGAVAGFSPNVLTPSNSFLRYEENKNSLIAASAVELKNAFMCTGRNFAYRKELYNEVGGFEKIKQSISGDDDLFLQLVQRETRWKIRYMTSPESYVRTALPDSFKQFINQRTRHVSASKFYPVKIQFLYSLIHLFHLSIVAGFFVSPFITLIAWMIKFNIDGAFVARGKKIFNAEFSVPEFIRNEILLVLYSFLIAPLGFLVKFDWKGTAHT
jgi:cellulose synthase/poly-beta-1,6-N-acetylglucosamine synthase-like glycosyltransferase